MTIAEVISKVDSLLPNTYTTEEKVSWLSQLDARVYELVIKTHESQDQFFFYGYNSEEDQETELIIPAPFDEAYLRWLEAQIHYHNSEDDRYNNAIILFNNAYEGYKNHYIRTHMPKNKGSRFVF